MAKTAPRPNNGCKKATEKYEPAADQGYNDGWAGLVYGKAEATCGLQTNSPPPVHFVE